MTSFEIVYLQNSSGSAPFKNWYERLNGIAARKVYEALIRMEAGHFSDSKPLRLGIWERRIHSGPGYRLYYGLEKQHCIIMLMGGTKRTQRADINKAGKLWHEYKTRMC